MEKVGDAALTYEKTIKLTDDDGQICNVINYRHYNKKRKRLGSVPNGESQETGNNP